MRKVKMLHFCITFLVIILPAMKAMEAPEERKEKEPLLCSQAATQQSLLQKKYESFVAKWIPVFKDRATLFSQIPADIHYLLVEQLVNAEYGNEYADFRRRYQYDAQKGFIAAIRNTTNPFITDDNHILSFLTDEFNVDTLDDTYNLPPLAWALLFKRTTIVRALLEMNATIATYQVGNEYDMSAVFRNASRKKDQEIAYRTSDLWARTPLEIAIHNNDLDSLKVLLEKGCNPDDCGRGPSPLDQAYRKGNREIIKILQSSGAMVYTREDQLLHARIRGNTDLLPATYQDCEDPCCCALCSGRRCRDLMQDGFAFCGPVSFWCHQPSWCHHKIPKGCIACLVCTGGITLSLALFYTLFFTLYNH